MTEEAILESGLVGNNPIYGVPKKKKASVTFSLYNPNSKTVAAFSVLVNGAVKFSSEMDPFDSEESIEYHLKAGDFIKVVITSGSLIYSVTGKLFSE